MTRPAALPALLALLLATPPIAAHGRARRHRAPPTSFTGPVNLRLLRTERAAADGARLALPTVLPAVCRCFDLVRFADPAALADLRRIDVVVRLALDGRATAVEFDQPLVARGLSACLGDALLTWRQTGVTHPRASVSLSLELPSP